MDYVLELFDKFALDRMYATLFPSDQDVLVSPGTSEAVHNVLLHSNNNSFGSSLFGSTAFTESSVLKRDDISRQFLSLTLISWVFGTVLYLATASLSYLLIFDKRILKHPRFLHNQVWLELRLALSALPVMAVLTAPWFVAEVRGYSKLYEDVAQHGIVYLAAQVPLFVAFSDCLIYWIHRGLHHPLLYRRLHKPHHRWLTPSPYASHAFHPVDGYLQSLPYHVFPFLFPLHKVTYLALFFFINLWTVFIHDGEVIADNPVVNGAACHSVHHLYFRYNYGQFTTLWDRIGGSYRRPEAEIVDAQLKLDPTVWTRQSEAVGEMIRTEEDDDSRTYVSQGKTRQD